MDNGLTVIICSYNGAPQIEETIRHLALQSFTEPISWEVIFVDNASTDNCAYLALMEWNKFITTATNFRVINEDRPGKIYALEKAVSVAHYDCMLICDDDNWLNADYVEMVYNILKNNPAIGAVGGQSTVVTDGTDLPDWFAEMASSYAAGQQATNSGDVTARGYLWGAGIGTRTMLYKLMYHNFPSYLTGRKSDLISCGEDSEYCQRLILKGYRLYYEQNLIFKHYIPAKRLELKYKYHLLEGLLQSSIILDNYYLASGLKATYDNKPFKRLKTLITKSVKYYFSRGERKELLKKKLYYLFGFDFGVDEITASIKRFMTNS